MQFGVIVSHEKVSEAISCGVDYVEPMIVGNVVKSVGGVWLPGPAAADVVHRSSFAMLFPPDLSLSDPVADLDDVRDYLETTLSLVAGVASPGAVVVLGSGAARRIPDGVSTEDGRARFVESLRLAAVTARRLGLEIVLEPLHRGESNLIHTIDEAVEFLDAAGLGDMRVVADLYHIMLEDEPLGTLRTHADRIGHAHVADTGRLAPGTGDWPVAEFVSTLREIGYQGNVSIECSFDDFPTELRDAAVFLRSI